MSQKTRAQESKTTESVVGRIERGRGNPTITNLFNIAEALGTRASRMPKQALGNAGQPDAKWKAERTAETADGPSIVLTQSPKMRRFLPHASEPKGARFLLCSLAF